MFNVVLVHPEIPPNTGNVIRLCANSGCNLHLIEPLGFSIDDARLRRAGLDYHEFTSLRVHASWADLVAAEQPGRCFGLSVRGTRRPSDCHFERGDWLLFGSETSGLTTEILDHLPPRRLLRLPMRPDSRSMNLSNAVAVVVYEAWRQHGFEGGA